MVYLCIFFFNLFTFTYYYWVANVHLFFLEMVTNLGMYVYQFPSS